MVLQLPLKEGFKVVVCWLANAGVLATCDNGVRWLLAFGVAAPATTVTGVTTGEAVTTADLDLAAGVGVAD